MKFVALLSGGKDSLYSAMEAVSLGHTLICGANLAPETLKDGNSPVETDSYMYQTAGHEVVLAMADCLQVPLVRGYVRGSPLNQGLSYEVTPGDEVEDMFLLLLDVKRRFPQVEAVCCGAILSTYQRLRLENICHRLDLTSLCYLWQRNQSLLLSEMIENKMKIILVKVATIGLKPRQHLNIEMSELHDTLEDIHEQYGVHVCGEGGEYETLTLDCPLFRKQLILDQSKVVIHSDDAFSPVGLLVVSEWHTELKLAPEDATCSDCQIYYVDEEKAREEAFNLMNQSTPTSSSSSSSSSSSTNTPSVHVSSDQVFVSGVTGIQTDLVGNEGTDDILSEVKRQTRLALTKMQTALEAVSCSMGDVCYVHLYVSDMSHFATINSEYSEFFGCYLPPSRSCVAADLSTGVYLLVDCWAIVGSRVAMLAGSGEHAKKRSVLHVQSLSRWAPVCIGPYSQANILMDNGLILVAGQIGLVPETMLLRTELPMLNSVTKNQNRVAEDDALGEEVSDYQPLKEYYERCFLELDQAVWNSAQILHSLDASLGGDEDGQPLIAILYINTSYIDKMELSQLIQNKMELSQQVYMKLYCHCLQRLYYGGDFENGFQTWKNIVKNNEMMKKKKNIKRNNRMNYSNLYGMGSGGFNMISNDEEDEEDDEEDERYEIDSVSLNQMESRFSLKMVGVPNLPKNAKVEIEIVSLPLKLESSLKQSKLHLTVRKSYSALNLAQEFQILNSDIGSTIADTRGGDAVDGVNDLFVPSWLPQPFPSVRKTRQIVPQHTSNSSSLSSSLSSPQTLVNSDDKKNEIIDSNYEVSILASIIHRSMSFGFISVENDTSKLHQRSARQCCHSLVNGIAKLLQNSFKDDLDQNKSFGWWSLSHVRVFFVSTMDNNDNDVIEEKCEKWNEEVLASHLRFLFLEHSKHASPALTIIPITSLPSTTASTSSLLLGQITILDSLKFDTDRWVLGCD